MKININIIAAVSDNGVIGKNGALPWHIPEDLKRFRELTEGHTVVMGRKTFESLPDCVFKNRNCFVISKTLQRPKVMRGMEIIWTYPSVGWFLVINRKEPLTWIIGGSTIYREFMPHAQRMYITRVHQTIEDGTAFFPEIDLNVWHLEDVEKHDGFDFEVYSK